MRKSRRSKNPIKRLRQRINEEAADPPFSGNRAMKKPRPDALEKTAATLPREKSQNSRPLAKNFPLVAGGTGQISPDRSAMAAEIPAMNRPAHDLGDRVPLRVKLAADPDHLSVAIKEPSGTLTTYQFNPFGGPIVRVGPGEFLLRWDTREIGTHWTRWQAGPGSVVGAAEMSFRVRAPRVPT